MSLLARAGAGVVVALGPEVDPAEWKVGDRAGVKPYYSTCGKCRLCKTGAYLRLGPIDTGLQ